MPQNDRDDLWTQDWATQAPQQWDLRLNGHGNRLVENLADLKVLFPEASDDELKILLDRPVASIMPPLLKQELEAL